jgi:hypothetical protein
MFRTCAIFVLASAALAGCAAQYQGPTQADLDAGIRRDIQIGKETCARSFPISPRTNHAAQARCYNEYEVAVIRSRMRYADLSSLVNAKRLALAEKADRGDLTEAQMAETITYVTGESERRANSSAQTQAQINTALAAQSSANSAAMSVPNTFTVPDANPCPVLVGGRCR